jgi:magnesium-transporting ATPase (P-type)
MMNQLLAYAGQVCSSGSCGEAEVNKSLVAGLVATLGVFFFVVIILVMLALAFWIWMLVDAIKREESSYEKLGSGEKNLWVILLIVSLFFSFNFIMALMFYFVIFQKSKKQIVTDAKK